MGGARGLGRFRNWVIIHPVLPPPHKKGGGGVTLYCGKMEAGVPQKPNTKNWLELQAGDNMDTLVFMCHMFVDKIRGSRNSSPAFIEGTANLHTSSFKKHAKPWSFSDWEPWLYNSTEHAHNY